MGMRALHFFLISLGFFALLFLLESMFRTLFSFVRILTSGIEPETGLVRSQKKAHAKEKGVYIFIKN